MIADKLLVTTTMTHPSWLEAVQWCVLAGGRSLPLLLLQRLRQQSVLKGVIVEVGMGTHILHCTAYITFTTVTSGLAK